MAHRNIAKRYAKSLLLAGQRTKQADRFGQEIRTFGALVEDSELLRTMLADPTVASEAKTRVLEEAIAKTRVSAPFQRFLRLLLQYRRVQLLPQIAEVYQELLDEAPGVLRGTVVTAERLPMSHLKQIKDALEQSTGRRVELTTRLDESLLAGFRVELADVVLDATVTGQLARLAERLQRA